MKLVHAGCGGEIEFIVDAEETEEFEGFVLLARCKKCKAEEVIIKFGYEFDEDVEE